MENLPEHATALIWRLIHSPVNADHENSAATFVAVAIALFILQGNRMVLEAIDESILEASTPC